MSFINISLFKILQFYNIRYIHQIWLKYVFLYNLIMQSSSHLLYYTLCQKLSNSLKQLLYLELACFKQLWHTNYKDQTWVFDITLAYLMLTTISIYMYTIAQQYIRHLQPWRSLEIPRERAEKRFRFCCIGLRSTCD